MEKIRIEVCIVCLLFHCRGLVAAVGYGPGNFVSWVPSAAFCRGGLFRNVLPEIRLYYKKFVAVAWWRREGGGFVIHSSISGQLVLKVVNVKEGLEKRKEKD